MPAGPAILLLKAPGAKDNSENFGFLLIDFYLAVHQVPLLHWCFPARLWVRIWFTYDGSLLPGWQCEGEVEKRGEAVAWRGLLHLLLLPSLEVGSLFEGGEVQPGVKDVFRWGTKWRLTIRGGEPPPSATGSTPPPPSWGMARFTASCEHGKHDKRHNLLH